MHRNKFEEKYNCGTFDRGYYLRFFLDNAKFMKAFIETLKNNLPEIIYNRQCKHCMSGKDCKQCEKCKDDSVECKDHKKQSGCCKKCCKIINVILNK